MLSKAVLSFVGRLVGVAAVLVSPLAVAAEAPDAPSSAGRAAKASDAPVAQPAASHGRHHKNADKKAKHRGSRHVDPSKDGIEEHEASEPAVAKRAKASSARRCDDPEVTTERASAKNPPKPSTTPLPSLAAVTSKPLVETITTKTEITVEGRGHAVEPRRTPIVRASLHTKDADADTDKAPARKEKHPKAACLNAPVNVTRGTEEETFPLTKCDGSALPHAVDEMSVLVRPGSAAKPSAPIGDEKAKAPAVGKNDELAPGIKKIDERLVERLQLVVDHFAKPAPADAGSTHAASRAVPKIFVVSGYRPTSKGSFHAMGRAIDFRLDGVENTDLVAFCKTLPDTGCGFYPNSSFIHLDVRDAGSGHVAWIDASSPGEKPEYVAAWPVPPSDDDPVKLLAKLDELQILPPASATAHDEPAEPAAKTAKHDESAKRDDREASEKKSEKCADEPAAASISRKLEDQ